MTNINMSTYLLRLFSRDLQDLSTDDENSYVETQGLLNTLYINSVIFAVLMTFYEMNRHMRSIYLKRLTSKFKKSNRVPTAPSKYPFSWIVTVLRITDDELLRMVGLDGYMLVRYINVCLKMSFFLTLLGLVVLVPVYSFAQNKHFSWTKYTLANIPNDPSAHQLWVPAIFAYIFSTYFCHLMYVEYRNFVKKRIQYLVQGDPDTPPQTYYTLMVEKVPINLRSAPALEAFFENLFPGEVHSVEVALDLKELDMMTKHRRYVRDSLEKSIALSKATGRQQLQWIRKDFYEDAPPFAVKANKLAKLFGCIVVDAIEHRTRLLAELNSLVRVMQLATFEKRHIVIQEETRRQQNIHGKIEAHLVREVRNFFKAGISSFVVERDRTLNAAKSCLMTYESHLEPDLIAEAELGQCEGRCAPLLRGCSFIASPRKSTPSTCDIEETKECRDEGDMKGDKYLNPIHGHSSQDTASNDSTLILVKDGSACDAVKGVKTGSGEMTAAEEVKCMSDNDRDIPDPECAVQGPPLNPNSGTETEDKEQNRRGKQQRPRKRKWKMIGSILRIVTFGKMIGIGLVVFGKRALAMTVTGIRWFLRSLLEGVRTVELLTVGACYKTSSTAFVTLKSRVAKSSAHQMFLSHVHYSMVVKSAPNPKDCIWENISIPARQIEMRKTIADCCLIVGAVFWSIVVGFITTIANLESLSKELPWLNAYRNTAIYDVLNQYLAVGVLLILLSILPFLFDVIARSYEGRKLESEIQNSIMTRYFYYQLANVFVSVGLGSIATSIHQILQNPSSILSILGTSLPTLSVYFTNLLIVKSFTAVPLELLRIWPLICVLSVRSCRNKNKCTIRELKRGAFANPPILYGWIYPNLLMVLMIISTYCCIAPMLVPFGLLFYAFAYLMYKYQLLFVYVNKYQSGGYMWYAVFNRSMVALMAGVLTLLGYLGIRETFFSGPFYLLAPLPFCITYFWYKCEDRFKTASMSLSLESAIDLDREAAQRSDSDLSVPLQTFHPALFRQPSLAEGQLKPQPYRRVHSVSDPFGVLRAQESGGKHGENRDFGSYDSSDDQQKSECPRSGHVGVRDDTGRVTGPQLISAGINKSGNVDMGQEGKIRITQYRGDSDPSHGNIPPNVLIPKGMGLNMCEYEQFNSSLSSPDPAEIDCYHDHKRYDIARSRSRSISIDEDEDRDSGDERDVNEILDYAGVLDCEENSGSRRDMGGCRTIDTLTVLPPSQFKNV